MKLDYGRPATPSPEPKPKSFRFSLGGPDDLSVTLIKWLIFVASIAWLVAVLLQSY